MGFPRQITGKWAKWQTDRTWETLEMEEVLRVAGMKLAAEYIGLRQAMVAQWVALRPLLEVCVMETGYEGRGLEAKVVV